jgi:hypothetical protein
MLCHRICGAGPLRFRFASMINAPTNSATASPLRCRRQRITWYFTAVVLLVGCRNRSQPESAEQLFSGDVQSLAKAAARGDHQTVDRLVATGVDVNAIGSEGMTPLLWAVKENNLVGFSSLLAHGADPNALTDTGKSAVNVAAGMADLTWLRLCLAYGGDPNLVNAGNPHAPGQTPIYYAIREHNAPAVKVLIESGADLEIADATERSPLYYACEFADYEIIYVLLRSGADYSPNNPDGLDPVARLRKFHRFSKEGDAEARAWYIKIVALLETKGVDMTGARESMGPITDTSTSEARENPGQ